MILEVDDRGRIERIAVPQGDTDREINGRRFIGGYRLNTQGFESIWFDKAVWDVSLVPDGEHVKVYRLTRKAS